MKKPFFTMIALAVFVSSAWLSPALAQGFTPRDAAVLVDVLVDEDPARIVLHWSPDLAATAYRIYRKKPADAAWGKPMAELAGDAPGWIDADVRKGDAFEYRVECVAEGRQANGYVYAGVCVPLEDQRGGVVLLVEESLAAPLAKEIARLESDLIGDGWTVTRHDVARSASVPNVKQLIRDAYGADPSAVRAVLILGHVPVPYSGEIVPDGHVPDHRGAWPADAYYADMDGEWGDTAVNNAKASSPRNHNVPGDGKFDPSRLPSDLELMVGRVDMSDLPAFGLNEVELTRRYLDKNHAFRHGHVIVEQRALIHDNFGWFGGGVAFAASGWRSFAPLVGRDNVTLGPLMPAAQAGNYLWVYGCGPGSQESVGGVITTADFGGKPFQGVFTFLFGSYHGDWDHPNNVMRAALAADGATLTCGWSGFPHWFVHPMGLGLPIGYSARLTQNNSTLYQGPGGRSWSFSERGIHIALLGDPTLRLHPASPVSDLVVRKNDDVCVLSWSAPAAERRVGYHVYRAEKQVGPYVRLTQEPVKATEFRDKTPVEGAIYQVHSIVLQESPSGTYFNQSQGVFTGGGGVKQ